MKYPLAIFAALLFSPAFAAEPPADDSALPAAGVRSETFYLSKVGTPGAAETASRKRTIIMDIAKSFTASRKTEKGWLERKTPLSTILGEVSRRISSREFIIGGSTLRYLKTASPQSWKVGDRVNVRALKGDAYDYNKTAIVGYIESGPEPDASENDIIAAAKAGQKFYVRVATETNSVEVIRYTVTW